MLLLSKSDMLILDIKHTNILFKSKGDCHGAHSDTGKETGKNEHTSKQLYVIALKT